MSAKILIEGNDITATEILIRQKLRYDKESGHLYWKISGHGIRAGRQAGSKTSNGYIQVMVNGKQMLAHRIAFYLVTGKWPTEIDHINRDPSDNRWDNLRDVSRSENQKNKNPFACKAYNKLGIKGVHERDNGKYQVIGRGNKYMGTYDCIEQATKVAEKSWQDFK